MTPRLKDPELRAMRDMARRLATFAPEVRERMMNWLIGYWADHRADPAKVTDSPSVAVKK